MLKRKKIFIVAGLLLIGLTAVWQFALVPGLTRRIPPNWKWSADFVGTSAYPDVRTGEFPDKDETSLYHRQNNIISESNRPRSIIVEDSYFIIDPVTGLKNWEYIYRAEIDPQTGAHLQQEYLGDYYVFPRFVEKTTYKFRNNYLKGIPLSYRREEVVEEVQTYLFSYQGRGEYTESYAGTAEYTGYEVKAGQEIKCAGDQLAFSAWVEPLTGEIVKIAEGCPTGDYFFEIATGKPLGAILRWGGETSADDNNDRADAIGWERTKLLAISRYIPLLILMTGFFCLGLAFIPRVSSKLDDN